MDFKFRESRSDQNYSPKDLEETLQEVMSSDMTISIINNLIKLTIYASRLYFGIRLSFLFSLAYILFNGTFQLHEIYFSKTFLGNLRVIK